MTDDHHLDDEALSAVLDGEARPDEAAHAEACATCSVRLAELRDAALLVGAPVPPPDPARREAAIATALAVEQGATVIPLRRRTPPRWLGAVAAAAAVVMVVSAVALLPHRAGDDKASTAVATTTTAATQEATADAFALAAPIETVDGGDLGDVDHIDLRQTISAALDGPQTTAGGAPAAGAAESDSSTGAASGQRESFTCDPEVRADNPDLGQLVFHAAGTLAGDAVAVLAYDTIDAAGSVDRVVYVAVVEDCAIRDLQTFAVQ